MPDRIGCVASYLPPKLFQIEEAHRLDNFAPVQSCYLLIETADLISSLLPLVLVGSIFKALILASTLLSPLYIDAIARYD